KTGDTLGSRGDDVGIIESGVEVGERTGGVVAEERDEFDDERIVSGRGDRECAGDIEEVPVRARCAVGVVDFPVIRSAAEPESVSGVQGAGRIARSENAGEFEITNGAGAAERGTVADGGERAGGGGAVYDEGAVLNRGRAAVGVGAGEARGAGA